MHHFKVILYYNWRFSELFLPPRSLTLESRHSFWIIFTNSVHTSKKTQRVNITKISCTYLQNATLLIFKASGERADSLTATVRGHRTLQWSAWQSCFVSGRFRVQNKLWNPCPGWGTSYYFLVVSGKYWDSKVKQSCPATTRKRQEGEEIEFLLVLYFCSRWGWAVSDTPRPRFNPGKGPPVPTG
jgi:hypothetical protein